ncbi:MAG: hypothetical protein HFJ35_03010 [Clostridia bacterium]|nr:hypothetical protein [Clostridia bacterium]
MNTIITLKDWCIENNRKDILKEYTSLMKDDIAFDNTKKSNPQNIEYNSDSMAVWKCQVCGRLQYLKVKERISLPMLNCSCDSQNASRNKVLHRISYNGTKKEVQNIIKSTHTSMPEQYIFFYIHKFFPDSIMGKKFDWLGNSEFDIYIPEIRLAIEYDGVCWHKNKEVVDREKNKLALKHNITLFRIREKGLPMINSTDYIYHNTSSKDYSNINSAINATIEFINENYHRNIEYFHDFHFDFYKKLICNEIKNQKVKKSICGKWPEINEYWDYNKNGIIKPEDIKISDKISVYAECPFCHENVEFKVYFAYRYIGKESFAPHLCDERNLYCLKYLKEYYKQYHNTDIQGNSLQERQVRDWKNHIKYAATFNIELQNELKKINIKI